MRLCVLAAAERVRPTPAPDVSAEATVSAAAAAAAAAAAGGAAAAAPAPSRVNALPRARAYASLAPLARAEPFLASRLLAMDPSEAPGGWGRASEIGDVMTQDYFGGPSESAAPGHRRTATSPPN